MRRHRRYRRQEHWARRRRVATFIIVLIVLSPFVAAGWYARSVTNAISDAQTISVVELPTRVVPQSTDGATPVSTSGRGGESSIPFAPADQPSNLDITRGLIQAGTGSDSISPEEVWPDKDSLNVMVLGIDSRHDGGDQNADVIILARLDLDDGSLRSISLPRDLEVHIPGHGKGKINGAYGIGIEQDPDNQVAGVSMMRDTIEQNFGIMIDEYVLIDFDGFTNVVDAVGGIDITVPETIVDDAYPTEDYGVRTLVIDAGHQHMDGDLALSYARTRHQDSDDERRQRQMLVIQALLDRGQAIGSLTRIADTINAVSGAALTSFRWEEQLALASMALRIEREHIYMSSLEQPIIMPGTSADGAWIYTGNMDEINAYIDDVLSGEVSTPGL